MEIEITPEARKVVLEKGLFFECLRVCDVIMEASHNRARVKIDVIHDPETSRPSISIGISMGTFKKATKVIEIANRLWWDNLPSKTKDFFGIELLPCFKVVC